MVPGRPPGWYAGPGGALQWWDGQAFTHSATTAGTRPTGIRGRPWLRFGPWWIPIAVGALFVSGFFPLVPVVSAPAVFAGLVPAAMLLTALWWMDRLEPEPRDAVVFAVLWGFLAASTIALAWNSAISGIFGEGFSIVVGAPLMEEAAKGLVLFAVVRRRLVDSTIDGAVYAVAAAVGFAVVEDISYFAMGFSSDGFGGLAQIVVLRGVLTPFAHPLFSIWMGMAAGFIAATRPSRRIAVALGAGSYTVAVALHAVWNGAALATTAKEDPFWTVYLVFAALLAATCVAVAALRRRQSKRFEREVPHVASLIGMPPSELAVFTSTRTYLAARKSLVGARRRDLAWLRWTLHAIAVLCRVAPRDAAEYEADGRELERLVDRAQRLRSSLAAVAH